MISFAPFERILFLFPTSIRLFFEYKWVKNKMTKNINKEMLKVLLNEIYLCCVSYTHQFIQNIERFRLLDSALEFIEEILSLKNKQ